MNRIDEELHIELENPKAPFAVIDTWCSKCLGAWAWQGSDRRRIYYFKRKQDVLMFRMRWL